MFNTEPQIPEGTPEVGANVCRKPYGPIMRIAVREQNRDTGKIRFRVTGAGERPVWITFKTFQKDWRVV